MTAESFSLLGGPLHQIGRRLGLVRGTNTVRLGLALGPGLWLVVLALSLLGGVAPQLFEWSVVGANARLLLVIPLCFVCESLVGPRMTAFVHTIVVRGLVPPGMTAALDAEVRRTNRRANAWWPEAAWLLIAVVLELTGTRLGIYGTTEVADASRTSLAALVYFHVGVTLFRFVLFRWGWKLAVWSWFLWRVSRLDLRLIPGHPDRMGGLGSLGGVHERFASLVAAISIIECTALAESISAGTAVFAATYLLLAMVLVASGALFIAPLAVFTDKLMAARTQGTGQYGNFAARYVTAFEAKWIRGTVREGDPPLLGTPDVPSLAALERVVSTVKEMRWITVGSRLLTTMTLAAVAPFLPLLLLEYPIADLSKKFIMRLVGL
jgi:hypothetical protein